MNVRTTLAILFVVISGGGCGSEAPPIDPGARSGSTDGAAGNASSDATSGATSGATSDATSRPAVDGTPGLPPQIEPATPGGRCDPTKPFGPATLVAELDGTVRLKNAVMTSDEREVFYLRDDGGGPDGLPTLRHGRRSSRDATWDVETVPSLDPPVADLATISTDGLTLLYYDTSQPGNLLRRADRRDRSEHFAASARVEPTVANVRWSLADDGIAYSERRGQPGAIESTSFTGATRGTAASVMSLAPSDDFLAINATQTTLAYRSLARGTEGVYFQHRKTKTSPFGAAWREPELVQFDDIFFISSDNCVIYDVRDMDGPRKGQSVFNSHVYVSHRPLPSPGG